MSDATCTSVRVQIKLVKNSERKNSILFFKHHNDFQDNN